MTPENLEKAFTLLKKYQHLQGIKEDFIASSGYRLQLRMEFRPNQEAKHQHAPDIPISAADLSTMLDMLLNDVSVQLNELGVQV